MKVCGKCKINKNESEFCKDKSRGDGLSYWCCGCQSSNRKLKKKQYDKQRKEWRVNNLEKDKKYKKNYYEKSKDFISNIGKIYRKSENGKKKIKQRRDNNRDSIKVLGFNNRLKNKYKLTKEEFDQLMFLQNNRCKICNEEFQPFLIKSGGREYTNPGYCVDHCHKTRKVRGLLCNACNVTLGKMRDSPELLRKAADYLEENLWK